uniref:Cystine knot toxin n=1 Tax=Dolomedes mizhoanus TaxID=1366394 RepID=S5MK73_9ARAC|nr:cystine knot toxin [Dolomedes mizhoanus]
MEVSVILLFSLVVLAVASASLEENRKEEFPEQQRACAAFKAACTKDDDCGCCGDWDKCDCNWPGKPGCYCMRGMIATRLKKMAIC